MKVNRHGGSKVTYLDFIQGEHESKDFNFSLGPIISLPGRSHLFSQCLNFFMFNLGMIMPNLPLNRGVGRIKLDYRYF